MIEILKFLLTPSNLISLSMISGFLLLAVRRFRRYATYAWGAGALLFIALGNGPFSYWVIGTLESKYPAIHSFENVQRFEKIVVLSGHAMPDPYFPLSSVGNASSTYRIIEAMRIWNKFTHATIVITGNEDVPGLMRDVFLALGLPEDRILIENESRNTFENATALRGMLDQQPFILVTSAGHMPRAIKIFLKLEMKPIPAPTDYMVGNNPLVAKLLPSITHLKYTDYAFHEYLGLFWYKLKGRI